MFAQTFSDVGFDAFENLFDLEGEAVGFGRIESVFGGILGIAIECGVVPLVEEAFVVVVGDIELVGTDGSDGSQEDVEGLAGLVAGTSE